MEASQFDELAFFRDALDREITADEREAFESLVRWFTTRDSTPEARLAYVRAAYRRWMRTAPDRRVPPDEQV